MSSPQWGAPGRWVPVNVDEDLWVAAVRAAAMRGTTLSAIVSAELQRIVDGDDDVPHDVRHKIFMAGFEAGKQESEAQ